MADNYIIAVTCTGTETGQNREKTAFFEILSH